MRFLFGCLLFAGMASTCDAQLFTRTEGNTKSSVNIYTVHDNTTPRTFKKYLFLGTGSYASRNTWERVCMELQDKLKPYSISAKYVYLSSDSNQARRTYEQLLKEHDFDVILWFGCVGGVNLKDVYSRQYIDPVGSAYNYNNGVPMIREVYQGVVSDQEWDLTLYTSSPNEIVWTAYMHTTLLEMKDRSYRKVANALIDTFEHKLLLPVDSTQLKKHDKTLK